MEVPPHLADFESKPQLQRLGLVDRIESGDGLLRDLSNLLLDVFLVNLDYGG